MEDGISIQFEQREGAQHMRVDGELSLASAGRMKSALLQLAASGGPAVINLAGITRIDLPGLQLLCSAHRTFCARNANFELSESSEEVRRTASDAGYLMRSSVCPYRRGDNCLWK